MPLPGGSLGAAGEREKHFYASLQPLSPSTSRLPLPTSTLSPQVSQDLPQLAPNPAHLLPPCTLTVENCGSQEPSDTVLMTREIF